MPDDGGLMACGAMPGYGRCVDMTGFSLRLTYPDATQAREVFGMLVDRFGTRWIILGGRKPI